MFDGTALGHSLISLAIPFEMGGSDSCHYFPHLALAYTFGCGLEWRLGTETWALRYYYGLLSLLPGGPRSLGDGGA